MTELLTWFDPQPGPGELPARMPSPFAGGEPHPLARRAAEALVGGLDRAARPGQMFGVLVVKLPDGRVGWLRAHSGMLDGSWHSPGYAPPLFDPDARDRFWTSGQAELDAFQERRSGLFGAERAALEALRAARSRELLVQIYDGYRIANGRGQDSRLWPLFAPDAPPGGVGDCAAPKLLGLAYQHGLQPLALAELWCGQSSRSGRHHAGSYYPACQRKCGRLLPYMLEGIDTEPAPVAIAPPDSEPHIVHEDPWLIVVDKPCGLASDPDRHDLEHDSVRVRLARREPAAPPPRIVRRLDADASGLVLVARRPETHAELRRQLALRDAELGLVAWLSGSVVGERGVVDLPVGGKRALTEWQVTARAAGRTRVLLVPRTGQPAQPRIHAAQGLGAPIVGDGGSELRLMLHAEQLTFMHPGTHRRITLERRAPF